MQNVPRDERWILRRIDELERRIKSLETSPRAGNTSISGGKLTVGAAGAPDRIDLDANASEITFTHSGAPAGRVRGNTAGGGVLIQTTTDPGVVSPNATSAQSGVTGSSTSSSVVTTNPAGHQVSVAEVATTFTADTTSDAAQVDITATSTTEPDDAIVYISTTGGVTLYTNGRTTDVPASSALPGSVTLYVKGNRLYYLDGAGTVRGPL